MCGYCCYVVVILFFEFWVVVGGMVDEGDVLVVLVE